MRKLALRRKIELDKYGLAGSYVNLRMGAYKDMQLIAEVDRNDKKAQSDVMMGRAKELFIGGKILIETEDGGEELVDMQSDDIELLPMGAIGDIFEAIAGTVVDITNPKALDQNQER